jgi:hypothetical protein
VETMWRRRPMAERDMYVAVPSVSSGDVGRGYAGAH